MYISVHIKYLKQAWTFRYGHLGRGETVRDGRWVWSGACARHRRPILPRFSHQHGRRRRRMKPERTAAAAAMTSSPRLRALASVLPTRRRTEPAKLARKTTAPATRSRAFSKSLPTVCAVRTSLPPLRNSLAQSRPPPSRPSASHRPPARICHPVYRCRRCSSARPKPTRPCSVSRGTTV